MQRLRGIIVAVLLGSGAALAAPTGPAAAAPTSEPKLERLSARAEPAQVATRSARWTKARIDKAIETAKPIRYSPALPTTQKRTKDFTAPARTIAPPAAAPRSATTAALPAPATHGRMYAITADDSVLGWCSASVINSGQRNLIMTAAHCLHSGEGGDWAFVDAFFVPQLYGDSQPYGVFWASSWTIWSPWSDDSDDDYDYGFVNLYANDRGNVADVVGANGLRVNNGYDNTVVVWGYPADDGYPGDVPYYCDKVTTYDGSWWDSYVYVGCILTGGASGGPWLEDYNYSNSLGYVIGLTSRAGVDFDYSLSPYFDDDVADLYHEVD
ncbi:peptidase [Actinoplanes capillaceus]|uniref:Peptidase n=1 Tax=Actinoplanes campanulatus TaxID=113559 RepID=A0ABQ3W7E4_9ACTN|nr:trypsin-like peptidase domain-containing protein [Actinoplanes capillaceus]GID42961.1 peptidase [Actinoplanes capillaceus]